MMKHLQNLKLKIFSLIGRCLVLTINATVKTQRIQCQGFFNETMTNVERLEPYGLTTVPPATSQSNEGINLFINGNRSQAINILIHNRDLRPTDILTGEVCLYGVDSTQSTSLNRITISPTSDKIEIKTKDLNKITLQTGSIKIENPTDYIELTSSEIKAVYNNTNKVTIDSTTVKVETAANNIEVGAAKVSVNGTNLEVLP